MAGAPPTATVCGVRPSQRSTRARRNRRTLRHKIAYAATNPRRVTAHLRRTARDTLLRLTTRDHVEYYRAVMRHDAAHRGADAAVGSKSRESWLRIGKLQFD